MHSALILVESDEGYEGGRQSVTSEKLLIGSAMLDCFNGSALMNGFSLLDRQTPATTSNRTVLALSL